MSPADNVRMERKSDRKAAPGSLGRWVRWGGILAIVMSGLADVDHAQATSWRPKPRPDVLCLSPHPPLPRPVTRSPCDEAPLVTGDASRQIAWMRVDESFEKRSGRATA